MGQEEWGQEEMSSRGSWGGGVFGHPHAPKSALCFAIGLAAFSICCIIIFNVVFLAAVERICIGGEYCAT
jgi:hypothetical protein